MGTARNISLPYRVEVLRETNTKGYFYSSGLNNIATNVKNGFSNPDYNVSIARGVNASSDYFLNTFDYNVPETIVESVYDNGFPRDKCNYRTVIKPANYVTPWSDFSTLNTYFTGPTDDIALKRLKGKLARDLDQFKALVPLAELNETRSLIRTTADAVQELLVALIDIKRGKYRALQKAGKAWLQFSFAISPTIADTNQLISSIGSYLNRENLSSRYVGKAAYHNQFRVDVNKSYGYSQGWYWYARNVDVRFDYEVQYTAGIKLDLRSANNYSLSDHFGLEFGQLPSVGWELIPFSWVADYFGTMGAFLEDAFSSPAGNTIYCTKSQKLIYDSVLPQLTPVPSGTTVFRPFSWQVNGASYRQIMFQRSSLSQLPHRALRFKTVDEIGVNSVKRLLNLASLLIAK